jgi:nucleoid DNA-binding protein
MNEIVQMVAQKFNLQPETAQQIVTFLLEQVKGKLPAGMGAQLEGFWPLAAPPRQKAAGCWTA